MRRTTAAAGVLVTAALSFGLTGTANAAVDRDCPDFASQADAQAAYNAVPGDPERLDADNDGEACEEYAYTGAAPQVASVPAGAVAAGDGSAADSAGSLPYVLGGAAFAAAGGAAVAARRRSHASA